MADFVFVISMGAFAEKVRDGASNVGVLLLEAMEADSTAKDYDALDTFLGAAGQTEQDDPSYSRKTGITGTITVDDTNDRVDVDIPDQTWSSLSGDAVTDLVVFYDEGGTDATRIPMTAHDFSVTPDGSNVTAEFNASGFARAS